MKTIQTQAVIEGIRAKKDRSLGLSISTPELTIQEKAIFLELQGMLIDLTITPKEEEVEEQVIDRDINQKTQAQRMRNVLYILWKQRPEGMEFEQFYKMKTEQIIEQLKLHIEEDMK